MDQVREIKKTCEEKTGCLQEQFGALEIKATAEAGATLRSDKAMVANGLSESLAEIAAPFGDKCKKTGKNRKLGAAKVCEAHPKFLREQGREKEAVEFERKMNSQGGQESQNLRYKEVREFRITLRELIVSRDNCPALNDCKDFWDLLEKANSIVRDITEPRRRLKSLTELANANSVEVDDIVRALRTCVQ